MKEFAEWLAQTKVSLTIQSHLWIVPTMQSVHIVAIGIVMASVFMVDLRIFGLAGRDQTLSQTARRFGPWLWSALVVLLATGAVMITGEPVRELLSFSFWFKMTLLVIGTLLAITFQRSVSHEDGRWDESRSSFGTSKVLAVLTFLVWCGIIVMGRLIAYDEVWGSWSLKPPI